MSTITEAADVVTQLRTDLAHAETAIAGLRDAFQAALEELTEEKKRAAKAERERGDAYHRGHRAARMTIDAILKDPGKGSMGDLEYSIRRLMREHAAATEREGRMRREVENWGHISVTCSRQVDCDEHGGECPEHIAVAPCPPCECGKGAILRILDAALAPEPAKVESRCPHDPPCDGPKCGRCRDPLPAGSDDETLCAECAAKNPRAAVLAREYAQKLRETAVCVLATPLTPEPLGAGDPDYFTDDAPGTTTHPLVGTSHGGTTCTSHHVHLPHCATQHGHEHCDCLVGRGEA